MGLNPFRAGPASSAGFSPLTWIPTPELCLERDVLGVGVGDTIQLAYLGSRVCFFSYTRKPRKRQLQLWFSSVTSGHMSLQDLLFPSWSQDGCRSSSHHYEERKKDQRRGWHIKPLASAAFRCNRSRQGADGYENSQEEPDLLRELES